MFRRNDGFTLLELLVVLAVLAILLSLIAPRFGEITKDAKNAVGAINAKRFQTDATYELSYHYNRYIRISDTVDLTTIGEVQDVEVTYDGDDTLHLLISTDGGDTWHSYHMDE